MVVLSLQFILAFCPISSFILTPSKVLNVKIHAIPGAVIAAFTATITREEVQTVQGLVGRSRQLLVIGDGPIQSHHKVVLIRRPSSQVPLLGSISPQGTFQPGLLHLLRVLILDKFVSCVRKGRPFEDFKKTMLFFHSSETMVQVNVWLMAQTGYRLYSDSPFAMYHSSLSSSDEAVLQRRRRDILLHLTTSKLLLGVNLPGVNLVVMVRPPSLHHALVQACGRAGRLLPNGQRETSMVAVLFNAQDLCVKDMSSGMKELCSNTEECLKQRMRAVFVGEYATSLPTASSWCCSNCDSG